MPGIFRVYSPHGQHHDKTSHAILLGFNGEHYDLLTHSYALGMGYRSYSPALMRFLSPDSLSPFDAGGLNLYSYCAGDPINFTDPSGHLDPKLLQLAKSRLKPTAPLGSQKLKVPARDKPVHKHSEKMPEGQSSTATASEHLQLSSPKRPPKNKGQGDGSILTNPASPGKNFKDRRAYYALVDGWFDNMEDLGRLRIQMKARSSLPSVLAKIESILEKSFILRDTAVDQYPYTDLRF